MPSTFPTAQIHTSPSHNADTPPNSPVTERATFNTSQCGPADIDRVARLVEAVLIKLTTEQPTHPAFHAKAAPAVLSYPTVHAEPNLVDNLAASYLTKYKEVNEVWDKSAYKYTTVDPLSSPKLVEEDHQYLYVVRTRIDKDTQLPSLFIDIKFHALQRMLSAVLNGVHGVSVQEETPTVEGNILFHFLPEMKAYRDHIADKGDSYVDQLNILLDFIQGAYASTAERLRSLLERNEITYDLLWALFKPNADIYTTCPGTKEPMCVRFNHGEEKKPSNRPDFFSLEVRYFDYDGKVFGEATGNAEITRFRGTKRIDLLDAYPLQYNHDSAAVRSRLVDCGRLFLSLIGTHHKQYDGLAFRRDEKVGIVNVTVKSRIMVDPELMRRMNPNYRRPAVETIEDPFWGAIRTVPEKQGAIKGANWDTDEFAPGDLLICSPTVQGFSMNDKQWLEFAVANITNIVWNGDVLAQLTLPDKQKRVVHALCNSHLVRQHEHKFDDFIAGKGGPPGVGKTMTAEAMSEHLQRPLYSISAGELGIFASTLEGRLSDIFIMADRWHALLLLDEADVYVEERASRDLNRNEMVCVFLRKLEYYRGILILTTNRVSTIDEAVASRIHLALPYHQLNKNARKTVWDGFLKKAQTMSGSAECDPGDIVALSRHVLNGREIKNAVSTAQALAMHEDQRVSLRHVEEAIEFNEKFQADFRGAGQIENLHAYQ